MSLRLGALLCLSGLAACSHDPPQTADNRNYVSEPSEAAAEPRMKPASLEDSSTPDDANGRALPAAGTRRAGTSDSSATTEPPKTESRTTSEPAKPASPNVAPDNTKVNKRDRDTAALTPLDQGENEADLKITQQIRQAVMSDKSLSFTAKNVKIITFNGKVTLRGPVNTAPERSAIEAAARKVAGATQVDNQLEVKK